MQEESLKVVPPPPRFICDPSERAKTIHLRFPVEYDGKVYDKITVRRLTAGDVEKFVAAVQAGQSPSLPMIDAPSAILDGLDALDFSEIDSAIQDFLPPSLKADG